MAESSVSQTWLDFDARERPPVVRAFLGDDELVVDSFAGGGGASTGIARAIGRDPDIAINHDPEAIAMHRANHPSTRHYVEDVYQVDPVAACDGRPVGLAWFSPDCKHHSKAKGGKPRDQKIRGLAWVAVRWAAAVAPRIIMLENVEEFRDWGPLCKTHVEGCCGGEWPDDHGYEPPLACIPKCTYGKPIANRRGQTFRAFVRRLERLGYVVEHRLLRACDFGAPTTRRRLFLIARRDGLSITWPTPSHGPGRSRPHRAAAEVIDWSIPCPSIFERERPLADKTMARIARGVRKFVLEAARPFIIPVNHGGVGRADHRVHDVDGPMPTITGGSRGGHALVSPIVVKAKTHGGGGNDAISAAEPLRTVTASKRGEFAIAVPYLVHRSNGERVGQSPRIYDPRSPLGTIVAQGQKHAVCAAFLAKHYGDRGTGGWPGGAALDAPAGAITVRDHHSLVAAHLLKFQQNSIGQAMTEPIHTLMAGATRFAQVCAFLSRYNGESIGQQPSDPLGTVETRDRYALVTVVIDGEQYVIVDIGMRMLTPRELFRAQGFPDDYTIEAGADGTPLTKTAQIRMCGNSVSPPPATAAVLALLGQAA